MTQVILVFTGGVWMCLNDDFQFYPVLFEL